MGDVPYPQDPKKSRNGAITAIPDIPVTNLKAMHLQKVNTFICMPLKNMLQLNENNGTVMCVGIDARWGYLMLIF